MSFWFQNIEEVNGKALDDVFQRYMHRFTGIEPQRQAFNKVRDIILDLGTTFADNVKIVIYVIDVFDQPIVISTRMTDNELSITINIDGTLKVKWEKETCSYKEVWWKFLHDVYEMLKETMHLVLFKIKSLLFIYFFTYYVAWNLKNNGKYFTRQVRYTINKNMFIPLYGILEKCIGFASRRKSGKN